MSTKIETDRNKKNRQSKKRFKISDEFVIILIFLLPISYFILNHIRAMDYEATYIDYDSISKFKIILKMDIKKRIYHLRNLSNFTWTPHKEIGSIAFLIDGSYIYLYPGEIKHRENIRIPLDEFKNRCGVNYIYSSKSLMGFILLCNEGSEILFNENSFSLGKELYHVKYEK